MVECLSSMSEALGSILRGGKGGTDGEREGSFALYFMSEQGQPTVLASLLQVFIVNECPPRLHGKRQ